MLDKVSRTYYNTLEGEQMIIWVPRTSSTVFDRIPSGHLIANPSSPKRKLGINHQSRGCQRYRTYLVGRTPHFNNISFGSLCQF